MELQKRNVLVLSACQATLQTTGVTLIAITGLAGYALAEDKSLATVPLTTYVLGAAVATVPASLLMNVVGRRPGFQVGTLTGIAGAAVAAAAIHLALFWLLCVGTFVMGIYTAFGKYYRFAAADAAEPSFRARAISLTLAGGIVGGVLGPEIAKHTTHGHTDHLAYFWPYVALAGVCLLATLILTRLDIPPLSAEERRDSGRPMRQIMAEPVFVVAVLASMLSYGIMNLMMTATPLAMRAHAHPFHDAAFVLQSHVVGMFAPSFFTGALIARFGVLHVIFAGCVLMAMAIAAALADTTLWGFWLSLVALGVGWNFMYVGGSALLTEAHTPAERAKTQAANDFMVFVTMAISSASSGVLLSQSGWHAVNAGSVPFLVLAAGATLWLMRRRRQAALPA